MPAIVTAPDHSSAWSSRQSVKSRPRPLGTVAWIIIAPEMLARASWVLPWRTQMIAFMISGSSVAIGDSSRAVMAPDSPSMGPMASSWWTNICEATKMRLNAPSVCTRTVVVAGRAAADFAPEVDAVGGEEQQTQPRLDRKRHQAEGYFDHEHRHKPSLVFDQARCVGRIGQRGVGRVTVLVDGALDEACRAHSDEDHLAPVVAAAQQQHSAGHPVGDGRQDQGAAHGCADTDVADLGGGPGGDGDEGDY